MESDEPGSSKHLVKKIVDPISDADAFLGELKLFFNPEEAGSSNGVDCSLPCCQDYVSNKLENFAKTVKEKLPKLDLRPEVYSLRSLSLTQRYLPKKKYDALEGSKEEDLDSLLLKDGFEFLSQRFPSFEPTKLSSEVTIEDITGKPPTMDELVEIIASMRLQEPSTKVEEDQGRKKSENKAEIKSSILNNSKQDLNPHGVLKDGNEQTDTSKNENNRSKRKNGERVEPRWCNPRSDPELRKELEEIMKCGQLNYDVEKHVKKPVLDDLTSASPFLPADIVKVLTSDKCFTDWEYSVKSYHGETTFSDESDTEDNLEEKEFKHGNENANSSSKIELNRLSTGIRDFDPSEFLDNVFSMNCEEVIPHRNEMDGTIVSYKTFPREEIDMNLEYDFVCGDLPSDSEDDEVFEKEFDEEPDEIEWKTEKITDATSEIPGMTQNELLGNLKQILVFAESLENSRDKNSYDERLVEEMSVANSLLDAMGIPQAGEVDNLPLQEIITKELNFLRHLEPSDENQKCPPGTLEGPCSSDDEDYTYSKKLSGIDHGLDSETTFRPDLCYEASPEKLPGDEDEVSTKQKNNDLDPPLFQDDEKKFADEKASGVYEPSKGHTEECTAYSEKCADHTEEHSEHSNESSDEEEALDRLFDSKFLEEYVKRRGTLDGLGDVLCPEPDGNFTKDTVKSYSEKCFTFPFLSKHFGSLNMARARRLLAQHFPELREEAFADLSKDLQVDLSDSDDSQVEFTFEPDTFEFEDAENMPENNSYNNDFPNTTDNEPKPFDPFDVTNHTYEDLVDEVKQSRKNGQSKRQDRTQSDSSLDDCSEKGIKKEDACSVTWKPLTELGQPSEEKIIRAFEKIHKLIVSTYNFKTPKNVSAWLKSRYVPTEKELCDWKEEYREFYGNQTVLDKFDPEELEVLDEKEKAQEEDSSETSGRDSSDDGDDDDYDGDDDDDDSDVNESTAETSELTVLERFKLFLEEQIAVEQRFKEEEQPNEISLRNQENEDTKTSKEKEDEIDGPSLVLIRVDETENFDLEELRKDGSNNKCKQSTSSESSYKGIGEEEEASINTTNLGVEGKEERDKVEESKAKIEPSVIPVIQLKDIPPVLKKEEWAEEVNCEEECELDHPSALSYPFELDGFQKKAINALEDGYNVFVSAHTSAGKTVVAEYAIAMSKRNRNKTVYTSPVKALSNQKYADFKRLFGSVGLITGDIQLNENAECLIMTTEILRSMLYNSSEKIKGLQFVIFDEVHYINDPERGHVWEEVLILLPSEVQIVMLSATVPNTMEFANWIGRTKQRKVIVCATHNRPVPLNHYLYTGTGGPSPGNTYLLKSGNGNFLLQNYMKAQRAMKDSQEREKLVKRKLMIQKKQEEFEWKKKGQPGDPPASASDDPSLRAYKRDQTMWISLISFLVKKDWLPAVSFVFSRMKCDAFADMLPTIDLTTKSEKSYIHKFIKSQIEKLDEIDQDLPQIQVMKSQLDKGIGIHHSGILPVMKEIVEVLFQEGKVKFLFATETFAMGVNMPARSVIFHSIRKFDGTDTRLLLPAEYVQMAGRAGRRGKDEAGNVIILAKPMDIIPKCSLETLLFGNPCKLISKFRLTYRMILSTLSVSGMLSIQNMIEQSYCENAGQLQRTFLQNDLIEAEKKEKELKQVAIAKVDELVVEKIAKFYDDAKIFIETWNNLRISILIQSKLLRELYPGRLLKICIGCYVNRIGMLISSEIYTENPYKNVYKVLVLNNSTDYLRAIAPGDQNMNHDDLELWYRMISLMNDLPSETEIVTNISDYSVISIKCNNIAAIFRESIKLHKNQLQEFLFYLNEKGTGFRNKMTCHAGDNLAQLIYAYSSHVTEINELSLLNENFELTRLAAEMWSLLVTIKEADISCRSLSIMKAFRTVFNWKQAQSKLQSLRNFMSVESMSLYPDFICKLNLLKEKGYINDSEQVMMKGFMAARIGKYELIVCEMLFENVLFDLAPEEAAALLSFLVYQNSSADDTEPDKSLPPSLQNAIAKCKQILAEVTALEKSHGIRDFDGSEISKLKFSLVPVMYAWAKQEPLKKIMEMELEFDFQEGMLVRWIQQLLETLKEVEAAARLMGDPVVPQKLQAAGQSIKRGIVFAPSLYTTMV